MAERLLDHDATPGSLGTLGEAVATQLCNGDIEGPRRHGEVEGVVAAGALALVEVGQGGLEPLERLVVGQVAGNEPDALQELLPDVVAELRPGMQLH